MRLHDINIATLLSAALGFVLGYAAYILIHNLYLHPLRNFPGPRAAAATFYWKGYIECIANRSFCHYLVELHAKYG